MFSIVSMSNFFVVDPGALSCGQTRDDVNREKRATRDDVNREKRATRDDVNREKEAARDQRPKENCHKREAARDQYPKENRHKGNATRDQYPKENRHPGLTVGQAPGSSLVRRAVLGFLVLLTPLHAAEQPTHSAMQWEQRMDQVQAQVEKQPRAQETRALLASLAREIEEAADLSPEFKERLMELHARAERLTKKGWSWKKKLGVGAAIVGALALVVLTLHKRRERNVRWRGDVGRRRARSGRNFGLSPTSSSALSPTSSSALSPASSSALSPASSSVSSPALSGGPGIVRTFRPRPKRSKLLSRCFDGWQRATPVLRAERIQQHREKWYEPQLKRLNEEVEALTNELESVTRKLPSINARIARLGKQEAAAFSQSYVQAVSPGSVQFSSQDGSNLAFSRQERATCEQRLAEIEQELTVKLGYIQDFHKEAKRRGVLEKPLGISISSF